MTDPERSGEEADPTRIRSIAVHREDVANALEATLRTDRRAVLRVTPPYSGRMRARIHTVGEDETARTRAGPPSAGGDTDGSDRPIHLDPADLVADPPPYPEVDETAAAYPDADVETRRERHAEAVRSWREAVREAVGGTVEVPVDGERGGEGDADGGRTHEVDVVALG
ncbi:hypothetical protein DQW50_06940 [Halorubrum sp. 48-1-W]|uniref:hypothetical protein n=1 Tax=Halorubrum sp. 48-1-W TaxID=2249761 RepID=UPI000DCCBB30|nr:hypothetical protein [Halorubrum sp. 48-1-W]RAW45939.1 hypothetical protein DQW50_06940 [Halorubrum sp. 48-1-W]